MKDEPTLATRLGISTHVSSLRWKLRRLMREYPIADAAILEDWLLDVANDRGVTVVARSLEKRKGGLGGPSEKALTNAELVVALCQPHNRDRPQWLRAAAQLVTRGAVDLAALALLARRERVESILAGLATQALKAAPEHAAWREVQRLGHGQSPLRDTLVHWTRLAEPVMRRGLPGAEKWRLIG